MLSAYHEMIFDEVAEAIDCGFRSVMIDGSQGSFEDNIALTAKVVAHAPCSVYVHRPKTRPL